MLMQLAKTIDALRVVPRSIIAIFFYHAIDASVWFQSLSEPNSAQSTYVAALWAASGVVTKFYVETGPKWQHE